MADGQSSEQPLLGLSLAFGEAQRKLQEQLATADSLDVKMGVLVGFLGALLTGILAAVLVAEPGKVHALLSPAGSSNHPDAWLGVWGWVIFSLFALDAGLVAAALITSFNAYRPRNLKSGIPFKVLYDWTNEATREIKFTFLPTLKKGIELNEGILGAKQRSAQQAAWITLFALLALMLTAVALVIRLKLYS